MERIEDINQSGDLEREIVYTFVARTSHEAADTLKSSLIAGGMREEEVNRLADIAFAMSAI